MTLVQSWNIVGCSEIARELGYSVPTISKYASLYDDFPKPVAVLKMGKVFDILEVREWHANRQPRKQDRMPGL